MARRNFRGRAAREGVQTGDGRIIGAGTLTWEDPGAGWPLQYVAEDYGMHAGSVTAGTITSYTRSGDEITYEGWLDDSTPGGAALAAAADAGLPMGPSVDLDNVAVDLFMRGEDDNEGLILIASGAAQPVGRVFASRYSFTLGARLSGRPSNVTAAAGDGDPADDAEYVHLFSFSADEMVERLAQGRVRGQTMVAFPAFADTTFELDPAGAAEGEGDTPEVEPQDDPPAVAAAAGGCGCGGSCGGCGTGHRGGGATVAAATTAVDDRLVHEIEDALAAVVEPPMYPEAAWFADQQLGQLTPLTITPEGRVFGHIAPWGQCHTGSPDGGCILTPESSAGLPYFNTGTLYTADGSQVLVGQLTVGGGHADIMLSYRGALAHYDDVATAWADVHAGQDAHGVWVAGAVRPGLSELQVRSIRAASVSGDWRGVGNRSELVAVHCVNSPGFPIARVAAGGQLAVVAAGAQVMAQLAAADASPLDRLVAAEVRRQLTASARAQLREQAAVRTAAARRALRMTAPARQALRK